MKFDRQEEFDEIVESVINGNYSQAGQLTVDYGFDATDLASYTKTTEWVQNHKYFDFRDLYWVIETATTIRMKQNFDELDKQGD